jgi:23S rRNA pseudouridine1911/1915/1917 synthase
MAADDLRAPAEAAGERLDVWLARALDGVSRARIASLIERAAVLVDGAAASKGQRLRGGERISIETVADPARPEPPPEPRIARENDDLLIVDKPAGLVVHPAPGHRGVTLVELLAARARGEWQPLAVHRLDRDTSGLMVVAKRQEVLEELQKRLRAREITREYMALVEGRLGSRTGTIEAPLGRSPRNRTRMAVGAGGREARTHFEVERFLEEFTLVRARLDTGRTHQIRAHFAAIGHPVAGDRAYGGARALGLERQFLHSARLEFAYSGEPAPLREVSPLPPDLAGALGRVEG